MREWKYVAKLATGKLQEGEIRHQGRQEGHRGAARVAEPSGTGRAAAGDAGTAVRRAAEARGVTGAVGVGGGAVPEQVTKRQQHFGKF